jgi:hypothetical protein
MAGIASWRLVYAFVEEKNIQKKKKHSDKIGKERKLHSLRLA